MNEHDNLSDQGQVHGASSGQESERLRILELLEQGKITAAEAADLLSALDERPATGDRRVKYRWRTGEMQLDRPRWFRVRVTDSRTGRTRANVTVPIGMVGFGLGMAHRLRMPGGRQLDDLLEFVRSGRRGTIFDVSSGHEGERVEIFVE